jgi:hypothetical protein
VDIPILSANWPKIELTALWTVNRAVEKLQLRPTFPDKPLIKTYVALWESCRSIAPLQLLYLENFDLVVTFGSYAISKQGKWNRAGSRRHRMPRVVRAFLRRTNASAPPLWTRTPWFPPPHPADLCAALRKLKRPGNGPGRATRRRMQHRAGLRACRLGQLAVPRVLSLFAMPQPPRVCVPTQLPFGRACRRRSFPQRAPSHPLPCHRFSSSPLASAAA